jgi:hypothetical protein
MGSLATGCNLLPVRPSTRRVARIGYLRGGVPNLAFEQRFLDGMRENGWIEGDNLVIERRFAAANAADQLAAAPSELVALEVEVFLASGGAVDAARSVTQTVPIVFAAAPAPVEVGWVSDTRTAWRQSHRYQHAVIGYFDEGARGADAAGPKHPHRWVPGQHFPIQY